MTYDKISTECFFLRAGRRGSFSRRLFKQCERAPYRECPIAAAAGSVFWAPVGAVASPVWLEGLNGGVGGGISHSSCG